MKKLLLPNSSLVLLAALALLAPTLPMGRLLAQDNAAAKANLTAAAIKARDNNDLLTAKADFEQLLAMDPSNAQTRASLDEVNAKIMASPSMVAKAAAADAKAAAKAQDNKDRADAAAAMAEQVRIANLISSAQNQRSVAAKQVAKDGNTDTAGATLDAAANSLTGIPSAQELVSEIKQDKAALPVNKAMYQLNSDDVAGARVTLDAYMKNNPDDAAATALDVAVTKAELHPATPAFAKTSATYLADEKALMNKIATGRSEYLGGNINAAEAVFKDVLILEPDNAEAKYFLERITAQKQESSNLTREMTIHEMLRDVDSSWTRPTVVAAAVSIATDTGADKATPIEKKLDSIMLPTVHFVNAPLDAVVQALELDAKKNDTSNDAVKGVNIILNEQNSKATVTIDLDGLSLRRVIEIITQKINYQYEVQLDVVTISSGGTNSVSNPNLTTEFFPVSKGTVSRITGTSSASSSSDSSSATDPFAPNAPAASAAPSTPGASSSGGEGDAIKSFFERAGVNFSGVAGSSLAYDGSVIIVTQNAKNIDKIRNILARYNDVKQVSIETKFIEVQEDTLNEIGVNWGFARSNGLDVGGTLASTPGAPDNNRSLSAVFNGVSATQTGEVLIPAQAAIPATPGTTSTLVTTGVGGGTTTSTTPGTPGTGAIPAITIPTTLTAPVLPNQANFGTGSAPLANLSKLIGTFELNAVITALSQTSGSELLSSPSVTVLSGIPASIIVAQELRYPQSYGDPRSTASNGGSVSITPGTPQEFTTRNVGIELKVTPTVEEDDYSISLDLNPRVTQFDGFIEYGGQSVAIAPSGNGQGGGIGGTIGGIVGTSNSTGPSTVVTVPSGFFQPVFSTREVLTRVTVWDGATLVMGGLTREEVDKVSDKVPVLGDIPFIGKLFQSNGETKQKRNLLIFVTANLVSPGGSLKKQDTKNTPRNSIYQTATVTTPNSEEQRVRSTPGK